MTSDHRYCKKQRNAQSFPKLFERDSQTHYAPEFSIKLTVYRVSVLVSSSYSPSCDKVLIASITFVWVLLTLIDKMLQYALSCYTEGRREWYKVYSY